MNNDIKLEESCNAYQSYTKTSKNMDISTTYDHSSKLGLYILDSPPKYN